MTIPMFLSVFPNLTLKEIKLQGWDLHRGFSFLTHEFLFGVFH